MLDTFDPQRLAQNEMTKLESEKQSLQKKDNKWDRIVDEDAIDDKQAEVSEDKFAKERDEFLSKMTGCSKDHGKEIDLYGKSYEEKIQRIEALLAEAERECDLDSSDDN